MATRLVVPTDDSLVNGRPLPRAFIVQLNKDFAQILANVYATVENMVNNPEAPMSTRVNAAREARFLIKESRELLEKIEAQQDAQLEENKSNNLRNMVLSDPDRALEFLDKEMEKMAEFRQFVLNKIISNNKIKNVLLTAVAPGKNKKEGKLANSANPQDWDPNSDNPF